MTECRSPELQDLLPEYAVDGLDNVTTARIAAHLAVCAVCTEELAVVQLVRRARPRVAMPDVARIVDSLPPAPGRSASEGAETGLRLIPAPQERQAPTSLPSMPPARPRRAVFGLPAWRLAATLAVVVAGGASVMVARHGIGIDPAMNSSVAAGLVDSGAVAVGSPAPSDADPWRTRPANQSVSVSYGDLGDYSEEELENMLDRLEQWDGATSTEPLPGVPILLASGGETP